MKHRLTVELQHQTYCQYYDSNEMNCITVGLGIVLNSLVEKYGNPDWKHRGQPYYGIRLERIISQDNDIQITEELYSTGSLQKRTDFYVDV